MKARPDRLPEPAALPGAAAPLLEAQGLSKRFGGRVLFAIPRLVLEPASAYVLTGMNGAGKSTLLRVLGGLEGANVEAMRFDGQPVTLDPYSRLLRGAVVYVHQHPVLFSTSVFHNIAYGLQLRGEPRARIAALVGRAMDWAGVAHLQDADPALLSGGEKQRVALARAKVLQPRLLLLDEPTANLDGPAREQVIDLIPTLAEQGATVVVACHDRDLIGLPGVRRMKLRDGQLELR